jgi:DNA-binding response OmpR family regulator/Tfp pilus assembly protein PilZ
MSLLAAAVAQRPPATRLEPRSSRHSVLLVEASEDARACAAPPVMAGCECVTVTGVSGAVRELERGRPLMTMVDARVFDTLPGEDVLGRLRRHPAHARVPVVLLASTHTPTELVEGAWRSGVADCLLRPVSLPLVRERIAVLESPGAVAPERRAPRVVLVVDEDDSFRVALARLLALAGHALLLAHTEAEALACATLLKGRLAAVVARVPSASGAALLQRLMAMPAAQGARGLGVMPRGCQPTGGMEMLERESATPLDVLTRLEPALGRGFRELRVHESVPFFCPVQFRELGREEQWHSCYSQEVSPGGLFLRTLAPPRVGAALELRIHLTTTGELLEGSGVVSWAHTWTPDGPQHAPAGMGIQFLGMSPKRLGRLRELCAAAAF